MSSHRDRARDRRARSRWLIELGGLVVKAGLPDLTEDDRATMLGAFLMLRDLLNGSADDNPADLSTRWRRRGLRTFDADAARKQEGNRKEAENASPG